MGVKKFFLLGTLLCGIIFFVSNVKAVEDVSEEAINSTLDSTSEVSKSDESSDIETQSINESEDLTEVIKDEEINNAAYMDPRNRSDLGGGNLQSRARMAYSVPTISATNNNTPTKSFVDISSHNGVISVNDFLNMKKYGVTGVVIKLTEYTTYKNEYAASQVKNAKAAGLKVSAYHYSWFATDSEARAEADYFAKAALSVGLDYSTVMVNDIEEPQILGKGNLTSSSIAFQNRLNQLGFKTVRHYSSLSWFTSGYLNQQTLGQKNIWVAAYPYTISNTNNYTQYGSWQWNSRLTFPEIAGKEFDISADYTNTFTQPDNSLISYSSHVQSKGWLNQVTDNAISGTVGESKRLEALNLSLSNRLDGSIEYRTHIQGNGWESNWNKNGSISGTTGQAKRIEALQVRLTGDVANKYDVYYRVHSQYFGWMNWAKNGESAGTEGFSYRLEAYQVQLVPKGQTGPVGSGNKFVKYQDANIEYQTHIQTKGWLLPVESNQISGTEGQGLRMEAIKLKVSNNPLGFSGNIEYQSHIQKVGWQNWKNNYNLSGTEGQGLRNEAIKIRLTGDLATHYNLYYRVHSQSYGWLGWAKNGETAGTTGKGKRIEAIQIMIVRRNGLPPVSNLASWIE
ncbi:GH25 family lysozyme [Enterococcus sp. 22-H-5-01]|uniref:GH25 family lysozyme n=1 Tax=Enterococcus sp. 22-H-5-01 TaxID=3418555 RepID=UPI003CFEF492